MVDFGQKAGDKRKETERRETPGRIHSTVRDRDERSLPIYLRRPPSGVQTPVATRSGCDQSLDQHEPGKNLLPHAVGQGLNVVGAEANS
jgi:hypothetical protein